MYLMPIHMRVPRPNGTRKRCARSASEWPSSQRLGLKELGFGKMNGSIRTEAGGMLTKSANAVSRAVPEG